MGTATAAFAVLAAERLGQCVFHLGLPSTDLVTARPRPRIWMNRRRRCAHELNLPDLRFWLVPGYPYVVFYMECDAHVDVWRVLHAQRDIPSWMVE